MNENFYDRIIRKPDERAKEAKLEHEVRAAVPFRPYSLLMAQRAQADKSKATKPRDDTANAMQDLLARFKETMRLLEEREHR